MNGILWILRTGAPWKDLPQRYPPYQTCPRHFQQWVEQGVFKRIAIELFIDNDQLFDDRGIEMIELYKKGRKKQKTKDGRKLRRYRRR
jgi:transposase